MSNNNELFPFPGQNDDIDPEVVVKPDLPGFPPVVSPSDNLKPEELKKVRNIIELFDKIDTHKLLELAPTKTAPLPVFPESEPTPHTTQPASSQPNPSTIPLKQAKPANSSEMHQHILNFFDGVSVTEVWEITARGEFKAVLDSIDDEKTFTNVFAAIAGIFPLKKCLRHGTPDQKLFALIAISDRFLATLSNQVFSTRKRLLKAAGSYLSSISEQYSFLQMENETFSPQYHERVAGSSASGRTIKEMHGYLVVGKDNRQVVRAGLVLT
jgi:hypothetical protein